MKFRIVLLFLIYFTGTLSAQEVKIRVLSEGFPLEYANIFINDKYYGFSDSEGYIDIRKTDISAGDTVAVSFVGMNKGTAIYIPDNYGSEGITIALSPNLSLGEAVIMANDKSEKLLRRYVNNRYAALGWFTEYHGNYKIDPQRGGEIKGSFAYSILTKKYADYYKLNDLEITPDSDTTGMSAVIRRVVIPAITASVFSVQIKDMYESTKDMKVKYMGKDKGRHVFLLIKPALGLLTGAGKDGFQIMIYADQKSREIVYAETILLYSSGTIIEFSADYTVSNKGIGTLQPCRIEGSISRDMNKIFFSLENISVKRRERNPIPRKDRK